MSVLYGRGSRPTAKQIAEAILLNEGNCCKVLYYCAAMKDSYTSDRYGDNCPLHRWAKFCSLKTEEKMLEVRKLLMGDLI